MVEVLFVNIAFALLSVYDFRFYKVKNEMILAIGFLYILIIKNICHSKSQDIFITIAVVLASQLLFLILSFFIEVNFGDVKLIGMYILLLGVDDGLFTLFIGSLLSLLPLSSGVKRVPMAVFFYLGYLIHFFLKGVGI